MFRSALGCRVVLVISAVAGVASGCGSGRATGGHWADGIDPAAFPGFALYSPGQSFDGLELVVASRDLAPPSSPGLPAINTVNFLYGTCTPPGDEGGCASPASVQISPACDRNFSLYERFPAPDGSIAITYRDVRVAGVPGIDVDEGDGAHRLELYSGRVTIVIWDLANDGRRFALARALAPRNAAALRVGGRPGRLPPPARGAIEGKLMCTRAERT
jgi:hypothetical protein